MTKVDLSVGITAHDEGYLAHKTIRCVLRCMEEVAAKGISFEIIINLDRGDKITTDYLRRFEKDSRFSILHSDFGDLGLSRNNIARNAKGKFLAFIDADDLVSLNWYVEAIKHLEKSGKELVLHPATELIFGVDLRLVCCDIYSSLDMAGDAMILAGCNRWTSTVLGYRKTFVDHPYMETGGGYGYEDYFFNTEVVADGIRHETVPETVMFYRRKKNSLLSRSDADRVVQPYTKLLDIDYLKSIPKPKGAELFDNIGEISANPGGYKYKQTEFSRRLPGSLQKPYLVLRGNRKINSMIIPVAKATKKVLRYRSKDGDINSKRDLFRSVPKSLIAAWKDMNQFEPQLYPRSDVLKHELEFYYTDGLNRKVGPALWQLAQEVSELPDYVFIVPWLVPGGSEKVLLNYINAIARVCPEWKIAVVTTEKSKNEWKSKLNKNAYLVDFGSVASKLDDDIERDMLFSRLIVQMRCKYLHLIQSDYGYRWMANHSKLMLSNYRINVSVFCNGVVNHGNDEEICGYIDPRLFEIYNVVDNIFTDNKQVIDYIVNLDGYDDKKKFKVHYQPVDLIKRGKKTVSDNSSCCRILWASRISVQKQPEILARIARCLEEKYPGRFLIDVYGEVDRFDYKNDPIPKNPVIKRYGEFSSFSDIPLGDYDMFLYTSKYDGLPNVILEAASAGFAIISSNVGGIGELIKDGKSGVLINDYTCAEDFVIAIEKLANDRVLAERYGKAAREAIKKSHTNSEFDAVVRKDICDGKEKK